MTKKRHIIGILLLSVFLTYFVGSNMFPHTHIFGNVKVAHSHPYNFFSKHQHHHSEKGIILIQKMSYVVCTTLLTLWVETPPVTIVPLPEGRNILCPEVLSVKHYSLRAPPYAVFV